MSGYSQPDFETLAAELKRAGADENGQIAGALWITGALRGIGRKKTPTADVERLQKVSHHLDAAMRLIAECDPWVSEDETMDKLVTQRIDKAAQLIKWTTMNYPGGHREKAHERFAQTLRRYFDAEELDIANSEGSPIVKIYCHCTGAKDIREARRILFPSTSKEGE